MLSRVADSLFWIAQNMERSDNMAKLLSVRLVSILENYDPLLDDDWEDIVKIAGDPKLFLENHEQFDRQSVIQFITFSTNNPNSIRSCIRIARDNAKMIREIIPIEMWEILNDLYLKVKNFPCEQVTPEQLNDFFQMILEKSFTFQGIVVGLMPRGEGYLFTMFGKYLERLRKLSRTLDVYYHKRLTERYDKEDVYYHYWSSVLNSVSGYESYLQKYQAFINPATVVNYLMFEEALPRSAKFSAHQLVSAFKQLEENEVNPYAIPLHERLTGLLEEVSLESIDEIDGTLHEYFQRLQRYCDDAGVAIMNTYFLGEITTL